MGDRGVDDLKKGEFEGVSRKLPWWWLGMLSPRLTNNVVGCASYYCKDMVSLHLGDAEHVSARDLRVPR